MPEEDEDEHRVEAHALGEGPADKGGGDDGKGKLEGHINRFRNRRGKCVGRVHTQAVDRILSQRLIPSH